MAARNDERDKWRLELWSGEEIREDMSFEMVDADERHAERERKAFRRRHADKQRADETGAVRHGDLIDVFELDARLVNGLVNDGQDVHDMLARGDLRHDAAEFLVHGDLRRDDVR